MQGSSMGAGYLGPWAYRYSVEHLDKVCYRNQINSLATMHFAAIPMIPREPRMQF